MEHDDHHKGKEANTLQACVDAHPVVHRRSRSALLKHFRYLRQADETHHLVDFANASDSNAAVDRA
jgi:hypothetical protein